MQTATKAIIEPIFEADFLECSYGYRPGKSSHEANEEIRQWTNKGYKFVLDADIKGYFDNINHEKLLGFVQQRISDRKILKLIRKWNNWRKLSALGWQTPASVYHNKRYFNMEVKKHKKRTFSLATN